MDDQGNIYLATGNGTFDADQGLGDYGDSILKLTPKGSELPVSDYFTPSDQALLQQEDGDLGSGGVVLLPDSAGSSSHPHLLLLIGKDALFYLVDRDQMGQYRVGGPNQIVQAVPSTSGSFSTPAFFDNTIYFIGLNDYPKAYRISDAKIDPIPLSQGLVKFGYPGGVPIISANGLKNAVMWMIQPDGFSANRPGVLRAFDARNLAIELYNSNAAGDRDQLPVGMKFAVPVVANGKVYVGTGDGLAVFGLLGGNTTTPPELSIEANLRLTLTGTAGTRYWIQRSTSLETIYGGWTNLTSVTLTTDRQVLIDPEAPNDGPRFYRAVSDDEAP